MTKPVKIGNIHIDAIDMDENVTRVVENLNNLHDEGKLKSVMVIYTTDDAVGAAIVGDFLHRPMLCLAADTLSEAVADRMAYDMFGQKDEDDDD
jgi:hypothetical protein